MIACSDYREWRFWPEKFKGQSRLMKRRQTEEPGYIWKFYKNPVYDFAHHESPIAQWSERSNRYSRRSWVWSRWGTQKIFFRVFDLKSFLHSFSLYPSHSFTYHMEVLFPKQPFSDPMPQNMHLTLFITKYSKHFSSLTISKHSLNKI